MTPTVASRDDDDDSDGSWDDVSQAGSEGEQDEEQATKEENEGAEDPGYAEPFARRVHKGKSVSNLSSLGSGDYAEPFEVVATKRQSLVPEEVHYDDPFEPSGVERMKDGFLRLKEKGKKMLQRKKEATPEPVKRFSTRPTIEVIGLTNKPNAVPDDDSDGSWDDVSQADSEVPQGGEQADIGDEHDGVNEADELSLGSEVPQGGEQADIGDEHDGVNEADVLSLGSETPEEEDDDDWDD